MFIEAAAIVKKNEERAKEKLIKEQEQLNNRLELLEIFKGYDFKLNGIGDVGNEEKVNKAGKDNINASSYKSVKDFKENKETVPSIKETLTGRETHGGSGSVGSYVYDNEICDVSDYAKLQNIFKNLEISIIFN